MPDYQHPGVLNVSTSDVEELARSTRPVLAEAAERILAEMTNPEETSTRFNSSI